MKKKIIQVPSKYVYIQDGQTHCDDAFVQAVRAMEDANGNYHLRFVAQILQHGVEAGTIIEIDQNETIVATILDERLHSLNSVPIGYSHLASDLCIVKKIDEDEAWEILKAIVVTLDGKCQDRDIVKSRIEELAEEIIDYLKQLPVYLYGKEFNAIHGARNYLAQVLGVNICQL